MNEKLRERIEEIEKKNPRVLGELRGTQKSNLKDVAYIESKLPIKLEELERQCSQTPELRAAFERILDDMRDYWLTTINLAELELMKEGGEISGKDYVDEYNHRMKYAEAVHSGFITHLDSLALMLKKVGQDISWLVTMREGGRPVRAKYGLFALHSMHLKMLELEKENAARDTDR